MRLCRAGFFAAVLFAVAAADSAARADTFVYRDREGARHEVDARLAGSGQRTHALELSDGQILLVPEAAVIERRPADDPEPINHLAMEKKLLEAFPADKLLTAIERPLVLAMVLARPVDQPRERAQRVAMLRQLGKSFGNVQGKFQEFIRATRVPTRGLRFPLVVLIFEADQDFNDYAAAIIGGDSLSARNVAGFYSALSNHLVLRLSECDTFQVPMHEFIHMQVHNRGVFERLAPVPVWFHEGIATSFEGERGQVRRVPTNITERYANLAAQSRTVTWKQIVEEDRPFRGDLFAGEAYGNAWGMHWLLLTQYKVRYGQYVRRLAEKTALEEYSAADRLKDFEEVFEKSPDELQREFLDRIARAGIRVSATDLPPSPHPPRAAGRPA
ncbi:MAG: DUF1570 domain-containing protein, partial [Planctomycetaceae bacterium]